jgi:hypothetical protein
VVAVVVDAVGRVVDGLETVSVDAVVLGDSVSFWGFFSEDGCTLSDFFRFLFARLLVCVSLVSTKTIALVVKISSTNEGLLLSEDDDII